jgi:hypothetical protein
MATSAANVQVAVTGAVYASGAGTTVTAPTTATSTLDTDLIDLGYIGEDGVVEHYEEDTTEIKAWQGGAIVRTMISSSKATFAFTMIENKEATVELYHKGSIMATDGGTGFKIDVKTPNADPRVFVIDVLDGTEHIRIYIPLGEVTERGDITYANEEAIAYPVVVTAYPNNGVVCTKFSDIAAWGPVT